MSSMRKVNPRLNWFIERMKNKLRQNQHKTDWRELSEKENQLAIYHEYEELRDACYSLRFNRNLETINETIDECADIANRAMMLADQLIHNYVKKGR